MKNKSANLKLSRPLRSELTQRRRRLSATRRRSGVILLTVVLTLGGGYLYLTNPVRVKMMAEHYFRSMVGGRVEIGKAWFSPVEGLRIQELNLWLPGAGGEDSPIFSARDILLRLRPGSLLTGRLRPTRIIAQQPAIYPVEDSAAGKWNFDVLLTSEHREEFAVKNLPPIEIRDGLIHYTEILHGKRLAGGQTHLTATLKPNRKTPGKIDYSIRWHHPGQAPTAANGWYHLITGASSGGVGTIALTSPLRKTLPRKIRAWWDLFEPTGGRITIPSHWVDPQKQVQQIEVEVEGLNLKVPLSRDGQLRLVGMASKDKVALSNVTGRVRFTGKRIEVITLSGSIWGRRVTIKGWFGGYEAHSPLEMHVETDPIDVPDRPEEIERFPPELQAFFEEFRPRGRCKLVSTLSRTARAKSKTSYQGHISLLGMAIRYKRFPYPLEQLKGVVHFETGKLRFRNLKARHGPTSITMSGIVLDPGPAAEAHITIEARNALLDADLRAALKPKEQELWDLFKPTGRVRCRIQIDAPHGVGVPTDFKIEAHVSEAALHFKPFPYPIEGIEGRMVITPKRMVIGSMPKEGKDRWNLTDGQCLTGQKGPARIRLAGVIAEPDKKIPRVNLALTVENLPLDEVLARTLPAEKDLRKAYRSFHFDGKANARAHIFTVDTPKKNPLRARKIDWVLYVQPKQAGLKYEEFPYRLDDLKGEIIIRPNGLIINDVVGRHGRASLTARGRVRLRKNQKEPTTDKEPPAGVELDVQFDGKNIPFDSELYHALPADYQRIWDELAPKGTFNLHAAGKGALTSGPEASRGLDWDLRLEPLGVSLTWQKLPYPLRNVRGVLHAARGKIEFIAIREEWKDGFCRLDGTIQQTSTGPKVNLKGQIRAMPLDERLQAALPDALKNLWDTNKTTGTIDLDLDRIEYLPVGDNRGNWRFAGKGRFSKAQFNFGLPLTEIDGAFEGELSMDSKGEHLALQGDLTVDHLFVDSREVKDLKVRVTKKADQPLFKFADLQGRMSGGTVAGNLVLRFAPKRSEYELTLAFEKVDLKALMRPESKKLPPPGKRRRAEGKVQGHLRLAGVPGSINQRRGRGAGRITNARIYRTPLLLAVLDLIHFAPPDPNAFDWVVFSFYLTGQTVHLEKIEMHGKGLSLLGTGTYRTDSGTIDLRLAVADQRLTLPILSELLAGARQELAHIRLRGTLDKPIAETISLQQIGKFFQDLLNARRRTRKKGL